MKIIELLQSSPEALQFIVTKLGLHTDQLFDILRNQFDNPLDPGNPANPSSPLSPLHPLHQQNNLNLDDVDGPSKRIEYVMYFQILLVVVFFVGGGAIGLDALGFKNKIADILHNN